MIQKNYFLVYIKMLEKQKRTATNAIQKQLLTIIDFDVETESKWLNKHGNKSTLKYRRELTPNVKFQADRIVVRNDFFEQVIKSCKATNTEFLMFKEKRGICPYEENYYKAEIIKIQDEKPIEVISKVSNERSNKELTKELIKESDNESNKENKSFEEMLEEIDKERRRI